MAKALRTVRAAPPPREASMLEDVAKLFQQQRDYAADPHEHVRWVEFYPGLVDQDIAVLLLAYESGMQVWNIVNEEATELFSIRCGPVTAASVYRRSADEFGPDALGLVFAVSDANRNRCTLSSINLPSRQSRSQQHDFQAPIDRLQANSHFIVAVSQGIIHVFDAGLNIKYSISDSAFTPQCAPCVLGERWLAYASAIAPDHGATPAGTAPVSVLSKVVGAAQKTGEKLWTYGGKGVETVSNFWSPPVAHKSTAHSRLSGSSPSEQASKDVAKGVIRVVDLETRRVLWHFRAHDARIQCLSFDRAGTLLASADTDGQAINVFHLGTTSATIPHVYVLNRGLTRAIIETIRFSPDSRWVAVTSQRGTSHLFPVHPSGGPVSLATHNSQQVENRFRFMQTSGVESQHFLHKTYVVESVAKAYTPVTHEGEAKSVTPANKSVRNHGGAESDDAQYNPCVDACFGPGPRGSEKDLPISLLVVSCEGSVVEHALSKLQVSKGSAPQRHADAGFLGVVSKFTSGAIERLRANDQMSLQTTARRMWPLRRSHDWAVSKPTSFQHAKAIEGPTLQQVKVHADRETQQWLSEVEIETYAAPHRRLWMGPQFRFYTFRQGQNGHSAQGLYCQDKHLAVEPIDVPTPDADSYHGAQGLGSPDILGQSPLSGAELPAAIAEAVDAVDAPDDEVSQALSEAALGEALEDTLSGHSTPAGGQSETMEGIFQMDDFETGMIHATQARSPSTRAGHQRTNSGISSSGSSNGNLGRQTSSSSSRSRSRDSSSRSSRGGLTMDFSGPSSAPCISQPQDIAVATARRRRGYSVGRRNSGESRKANLTMGTPPEDVGGVLRQVSSGLHIALGDAEHDTPLHKVESNVSVEGLTDAFASQSIDLDQ